VRSRGLAALGWRDDGDAATHELDARAPRRPRRRGVPSDPPSDAGRARRRAARHVANAAAQAALPSVSAGTETQTTTSGSAPLIVIPTRWARARHQLVTAISVLPGGLVQRAVDVEQRR